MGAQVSGLSYETARKKISKWQKTSRSKYGKNLVILKRTFVRKVIDALTRIDFDDWRET